MQAASSDGARRIRTADLLGAIQAAKFGWLLSKWIISRGLAELYVRLVSGRFAADMQGYAAICRESGTPGQKCPKFAQGGWK